MRRVNDFLQHLPAPARAKLDIQIATCQCAAEAAARCLEYPGSARTTVAELREYLETAINALSEASLLIDTHLLQEDLC